jgi:hypothetical protein
MPSSRSVTEWLERLKGRDGEAAQQLWESYFARLVRSPDNACHPAAAAPRTKSTSPSARWTAFAEGAARGRFPAPKDRHGLWPLLVTITLRKARKLARREKRRKRGGGRVRGESALIAGGEQESGAAWDEILTQSPSPAFACQVAALQDPSP